MLSRILIIAAGLVSHILAASPQRIISLSPNVTEILYGVGAFSRVVAVSQYCIYPPETSKLPKISGWLNSRIETAVALKPDLVVLTDSQKPFVVNQLEGMHLHWIATPSTSLNDIYQAIAQIGAATGHDTEAANLLSNMQRDLAAIQHKTEHLHKPTVLLSVSRTPGTLSELYVATQGSFLADLITIAGGHAIVAPATKGYGKLSKEAILSADPDIILDLARDVQAWFDLPELHAVSAKRVYSINEPLVAHPSQFATATAQHMAKLLHPEANW